MGSYIERVDVTGHSLPWADIRLADDHMVCLKSKHGNVKIIGRMASVDDYWALDTNKEFLLVTEKVPYRKAIIHIDKGGNVFFPYDSYDIDYELINREEIYHVFNCSRLETVEDCSTFCSMMASLTEV